MKTKPNIPAEQLASVIARLLEQAPRTAEDLARLTGYSSNAVRMRLCGLREIGCANRYSESRPDGGRQYIWKSGPTVFVEDLDDDEKPPRGFGRLKQTTVREYDVIDKRDPMVAALFGPTHKEAA